MSASDPDESSRTRPKNNLLVIAYDPQFPHLKVVRKCRSHLAVMGVPGANADHFLWPEEAVYLMENCLAVISKKDRRPMTVYEGYQMLEMKRVSFHKYLVYSTLKKVGLVVIRPRKFLRSLEVLHNNHEPETISEEFASTSDVLLDCFPSVNSGQLHMPQLHRSTALVPTECNIKAHPSVLLFSKGVRHRKPCRPPYWPSLLPAVASSTWSEYSQRKKTLIDQIYTNCKRKRSETSSILPIDFEVYNSLLYSYNNRELVPMFRVICLSAQENRVYYNLMHQITEQQVVFAIFENGKICFINSSGSSLDITTLL